MNKITKIDDNTIAFEKTLPVQQFVYDYGAIKKELSDLLTRRQEQFDSFMPERIAELTEILSQADSLGIIEKVRELPAEEVLAEPIIKP